jgi:hypothetical protein
LLDPLWLSNFQFGFRQETLHHPLMLLRRRDGSSTRIGGPQDFLFVGRFGGELARKDADGPIAAHAGNVDSQWIVGDTLDEGGVLVAVPKDELPIALFLNPRFPITGVVVGRMMLVFVNQDIGINGADHKALGIGAPGNVADAFGVGTDNADGQISFFGNGGPKVTAILVAAFADGNGP